MKNVDVEVYLNQLIGFFEKNPNDLTDLIGDLKKDTFYNKVREQAYSNYEKDSEPSLTQQQLIDIVVSMFDDKVTKKSLVKITYAVQKTKFGFIWLN